MALTKREEICNLVMQLDENYLEKLSLYIHSLPQEELDLSKKQKAFDRLEKLIEKNRKQNIEFLPYEMAKEEAIALMTKKYGAV